MKFKNRKLFKGEIDLWKRVTQNDKKFLSYIKDTKVQRDSNHKDKIEFVRDKQDINNANIQNHKPKPLSNNKNQQTLQANRKTISRLERGKLKPEASFDLHGLGKVNAKEAVLKFIKNSVLKNLRCVLIITGKKNSHLGAKGVLRESLPIWLKEDNVSNYILGHSYASSKDGGDGARYILLRKKNKVFKNE